MTNKTEPALEPSGDEVERVAAALWAHDGRCLGIRREISAFAIQEKGVREFWRDRGLIAIAALKGTPA